MTGLNLQPELFATPVVSGIAQLNQSANSLSTNDSAVATVNAGFSAGIQGNGSGSGQITVGSAGSVIGRTTTSLSATASSTNGSTDANASLGQAIGISQQSGESIQVGSAGSIVGSVDLNQSARSSSVTSGANASSLTDTAIGLRFNADGGAISTGGNGSVQGLALINTSATATTVGDNAASDAATSNQQLTNAIGLDLSAVSTPSALATVSIGGLAEVVGAVIATGTSTATTTEGNSSATAGMSGGVGSVATLTGLRTTSGAPAVSVGRSGSINGNASGDFRAIAASVLGNATSKANGSAMAVGGDPALATGGRISIEADAVFNATAALTTQVHAGTSNGDALAQVAPGGQQILGTALDGGPGTGLTVGRNAQVISTATGDQYGSSSTVNGSATTNFGDSSLAGVFFSNTAVQGDLSGFNAKANLTANGAATSVLGLAFVDSPAGQTTIGLNQGILTVSGSSPGSIQAGGFSNTRLKAESTNGDAKATLSNTTAKGIDGVIGQNTVTVGANLSRLNSEASQSIQIAARSTNGNAATSTLDGLYTYGFENVGASIGGNGNITATASSAAVLKASNIGSANSNGDAVAVIGETTIATESMRGIQNTSIGASGMIGAKAIFSGSIDSQSVNGNARSALDATNSMTVIGITPTAGSIVSIGQNGNITANSVLNGMAGTDSPFLVRSVSTQGDANARFGNTLTAAPTTPNQISSIANFSNGSLLASGSSSGNITAQSTANALVSALSTQGDANASFGTINSSQRPLDVTAIYDSDLRAGSAGVNTINATSTLNLVNDAQSVGGASTADGRATVRGVTDNIPASPTTGGNSLQLSGNASSISNFSNTALARSINGMASSHAQNQDVMGVNQYSIDVLNSGGLYGSAVANMIAGSSSVSNHASARSIV